MMLLETKANEETILIETAALSPVRVIESNEQLVPNHESAFRTRAKILLRTDELANSQSSVIRRFDEALFKSRSCGELYRIDCSSPCPLLPNSMLIDVLTLDR